VATAWQYLSAGSKQMDLLPTSSDTMTSSARASFTLTTAQYFFDKGDYEKSAEILNAMTSTEGVSSNRKKQPRDLTSVFAQWKGLQAELLMKVERYREIERGQRGETPLIVRERERPRLRETETQRRA
jgi:hypothetical protein